jgi:hypothetical protein
MPTPPLSTRRSESGASVDDDDDDGDGDGDGDDAEDVSVETDVRASAGRVSDRGAIEMR